MCNIRQTKAMKMRWLSEKNKLIGLVASDDDTKVTKQLNEKVLEACVAAAFAYW